MTEAEWNTSADPKAMLEFLQGTGNVSDRKLRLFACTCYHDYFHFMLPDSRGFTRYITWVEMTERYVDGMATREAWDAARSGLHGMEHVVDAHHHAVNASETAAGVAGWFKTKTFCRVQEGDENRCLSGKLRDIVANPFHPVTFDLSWRSETVVLLARHMYESRDFSTMPIMADALQDAGCEDENILSHCRGTGPHVRGCWVVDLVLGKE